jgi:hypothetical protein
MAGEQRGFTDWPLAGVLGYAWFFLFIFVTLGIWDRWGFVAGISAAVVWVLLEITVVKAVARRRAE